MRLYFLPVFFLLITLKGLSQKSPQAKVLYRQAVADTAAVKDSLGAQHFYEAAKEELKLSTPDFDFAARSFLTAAELNFFPLFNYKISERYYYEALSAADKGKDKALVYEALKGLGIVYENSKNTYDVFTFPASEKQETLEAFFSIMLKPKKNEAGKYLIAFSGGSNDGVYAGAEGTVYGKYSANIKGRANTRLGKFKVKTVYPNFSIGEVDAVKEGDPFYQIYVDDMAAVPIRFPRKPKKDVLLEVSLLNIKFIDNEGNWIAHPRTLMYYSSPQLENDVYGSMKSQINKIYDQLHTDTTALYHAILQGGRFKGKSMMDAMRDTKYEDLRAFFSFVRSFPANYMGGTWKIGEVYATWIINNAPIGAQEAMDSLLSYAKNEKLFNRYAKEHAEDIHNNLFGGWIMDAQSFAYSKDFASAYAWNNAMEKASIAMNDDSLLAWSYFNRGLIISEANPDSTAADYYKKAIPLFKKVGDKQGESYAVNNIGSALNSSYHYKEAQPYFEQALQIRLQLLNKDTSDDVKREVARAHSGIGYSLFKQSKYKEAIEEYIKGTQLLEKIPDLKAKIDLAPLYSSIGKSYQQMGQYKEAADYYELEYTIRKGLGDEEAMADAMDNKAYLLSLVGKNRESLQSYQQAYKLHFKTNNIDDAGFTMSNIGQMLWILGNYDSAIAAHTAAIDLRVKTGNVKGEASSWKKLGELYKNNGQPQKSLEAYNKALSLYQKIDDKENYAALLEDFAANYYNVKDYTNALKYYTDALAVYRKIQSKSKIADITYNLATVYYSDKQYEPSEKTLDSAILLQNDIKDQAGLLNSYIYKGLIQQVFYANYTKALGFMKQALQLAELTTSENNIAYTQSSIGSLYQASGSYDSAAHYFDLALARYKKLEDKKNLADLYMNRGFLYSDIADYPMARKLFDQSLEIAEQSGNKSAKANALSGIAQIELYAGNFLKAFELNNSVLELWKNEDNPWGVADAYISLGNVRNRQSGFEEAIKFYQKADSMYSVLRMEKARATSINNIGDIYFNQNDFERSLPKFFAALKILQQTNDDKRFISLVKANIGEVYIYQKKYSDAEKWLGEAMAMAKSIKNKSQVLSIDIVLGRLKTITREYAAAKVFFDEAETLARETGEKLTSVLLEAEIGKWYYLNNDIANAEKYLQDCISISQAIGFRTYVWKAYATMAEIRERQNNTASAITELDKAIKVLEELKSSLTGGEEAKKIFASDESVVELYQRMAKYLKAVGRNEEALAFIEKSNLENINLRLKNDEAAGNAEAKEKKTEITQYVKQTAEELSKPPEQQNKEKIARLEKMTTIAETDYQQFITDLKKKYPTRTDLQQIDARQFRQERKHIPPDVALLSYLITDNELSIFVAMRDTLLIKDIPIEKTLLEQKIRQYYSASKHPPGKSGIKRGANGDDRDKIDTTVSAEQLSQELYTILISPAAEAIRPKASIAIVPTGLLCFVPFHSLSTRNPSGEIRYFGEEKQVFYVNKITAVTNGRNEVMKDLKIIAVGNADKSLANAETEVKGLKQIYPATLVYIGNDATKKNVLGTQGEFNILHLATHGILDYNDAENSYLVFASDKNNGDDGKLKINDIYKIKDLDRFRMVTLSACETAVVQDLVDGWPISTASAFIEAGVSTVIATLWKVDDKATGILIDKFYENMKTMNKVAALQNAQQYLRSQKEYADPYYWAPFQLVGLWE